MSRSMSELDTDWYQYLAATPAERRKQCQDILAGRYVSATLFSIAIAIGIIYGLCKGWF